MASVGRSNVTTAEIDPRDSSAVERFIALPYRLHRDEPAYCPPLRMQQRDLLDFAHNPFYQRAKLRLFVAERDGAVVGRIAAILDGGYNAHFNANDTHWGFFDAEDDDAVAAALFERLEQAAREWNSPLMRGPFNPSINHECGLQVWGNEHPNFVGMPWNPPYYQRLVEAQGFAKAKDMLCFQVIPHPDNGKRVARILDRIRERNRLTIRRFDRSRFDEEAALIWRLYTEAWEENWGQYPMNEAEFAHFVADFKRIAFDECVLFADEPGGETVAFGMLLPNVNWAMQPIRDGRLLPFGWAKLLWRWKVRGIRQFRGVLLGVMPGWRNKGINGLLSYLHLKDADKLGQTRSETGWILEDNESAIHGSESIGGKHYKTYRIYEKSLSTKATDEPTV